LLTHSSRKRTFQNYVREWEQAEPLGSKSLNSYKNNNTQGTQEAGFQTSIPSSSQAGSNFDQAEPDEKSNLNSNTSVSVYPSSTNNWPSQSYIPTSEQRVYGYPHHPIQNTGRHFQSSGSPTIPRDHSGYHPDTYHHRTPNYSSQCFAHQPFTLSAPTFASTSTSTSTPSNSMAGYPANAAWSTTPSPYATTLPVTASPNWPANTAPTSSTEQYLTAEQLELISPKDAVRYVKIFYMDVFHS